MIKQKGKRMRKMRKGKSIAELSGG